MIIMHRVLLFVLTGFSASTPHDSFGEIEQLRIRVQSARTHVLQLLESDLRRELPKGGPVAPNSALSMQRLLTDARTLANALQERPDDLVAHTQRSRWSVQGDVDTTTSRMREALHGLIQRYLPGPTMAELQAGLQYNTSVYTAGTVLARSEISQELVKGLRWFRSSAEHVCGFRRCPEELLRCARDADCVHAWSDASEVCVPDLPLPWCDGDCSPALEVLIRCVRSHCDDAVSNSDGTVPYVLFRSASGAGLAEHQIRDVYKLRDSVWAANDVSDGEPRHFGSHYASDSDAALPLEPGARVHR